MRTTIFTAQDIERVVEHVGLDGLMDQMIQCLTDALVDYDERTLPTPVRDGFQYSIPQTGLIEWMPAMAAGESVVIKIVGYHPSNPEKYSLPTILSTAMFFDTLTGHLLSLLDSAFLTALRTGAATAIASRVLASTNSKVLGLIGAGAQSVTQLHALSRVFELEDVLVFDTDRSTLESFAERASYFDTKNIKFRHASLDQICESADIICTSTSVAKGAGPVFADKNLKPWIHVNAVGSDFPGKTELPLSLLERSLVCPDYLKQARREGECQQLSDSAIGPTLVQLLRDSDSCSENRTSATVFDSTGWALEDHVAVKMFLRLATELNCGTELELANLSLDPKSPYAFTGDPGRSEGLFERDDIEYGGFQRCSLVFRDR